MDQKTLLEKEKMLVTSIFSCSLNVFEGLFPQGCQTLSWVNDLGAFESSVHKDLMALFVQ